MRIKALALGLLLCLGFATAGGAAVLKITVAGPIQPITAEYIIRTIDRADREGAFLVILSLNTPGGLLSSMREIIEKIVNARTPIVCYVSPSGARAASAGFYIGVACDIFAMAPGTSTGAAHPVGLSLLGQGMDKTMEEKLTNDSAAYIKTLAEKRGRSLKMAEDAVRQSVSYTEEEAVKGGVVDLVARSDAELVAALDGRTINRFGGGTKTLALKGQPIVEAPMSSRQKFLMAISNPDLAYMLLMIGLLGLFFEFAHPGAILPGVLGGICLLLAVFAFQILPINYVGLLLILLALVLFILEVKVQGFGALGVGGIAAMIIGSLMLVKGPPALRPGLLVILPMAVGLSVILIFLLTIVVRAHRRRAVTGKEGMVGETGTARTDLTPEGKVFVHGEIWEAEAEGSPVRTGEKVRVIKVLENMKIRVEKA